MDANGQMRSVDDLAGVMRENVKNEALLLGDAALQKQYSDDFEKRFSVAKVNAVSEHVADTAFAPDAMTAIANLDKGNAGRMTDVWSKMTFDEKAKVRSNLRTVQIERQTTKEQNDKDLLTSDTKRVAELQSQFFANGSKAALDELRAISIRSPKAISPEAVFDMPKKRSEGEIANPRAEFVIKTEILQGLHPDAASIERRAKELGIGYKRLGEAVLPFQITRGNEEERDIEHAQILEALRLGDGPEAVRWLVAHLGSSVRLSAQSLAGAAGSATGASMPQADDIVRRLSTEETIVR